MARIGLVALFVLLSGCVSATPAAIEGTGDGAINFVADGRELGSAEVKFSIVPTAAPPAPIELVLPENVTEISLISHWVGNNGHNLGSGLLTGYTGQPGLRVEVSDKEGHLIVCWESEGYRSGPVPAGPHEFATWGAHVWVVPGTTLTIVGSGWADVTVTVDAFAGEEKVPPQTGRLPPPDPTC